MTSHPPTQRGNRLVIGVTGRIGAGKTSVARYLNSRHGFQYLRYSQVISEWMASDPESKDQLQELGWKVMAGGLQGELNRRLISQIKPVVHVAVDGLRHPLDFESLSNSFSSSFHLLYIECPQAARWGHLMGRSKYASLEALQTADSHLVEQQIESLRKSAAFVIPNEGALQALYAVVDKTLDSLRKEGRT